MYSLIILAAGESKRFPSNKLLYEVDGKPLIQRIVEQAISSSVDEIVIVTGFEHERIKESLKNFETIKFVFNPNYKVGGMSSSIVIGLRECIKSKAVLITPGDIPYFDTKLIDVLIDKNENPENKSLILIPRVDNYSVHPILLNKELFNDILMINEETRGLKFIIKNRSEEILYLEFTDIKPQKDVDNVEDLKFFNKK